MIGFGGAAQKSPAGNGRPHQIRGWKIPDFGPSPGLDSLITARTGEVALLGRDFAGTRLDVLVEEGEHVTNGAVVMRDRQHPEIAFTAPAGGVIHRIRRGARRALETLEIRIEGDQSATPVRLAGNPAAHDIRALLLESGIWAAMRSRPYGYLPLPGDTPAALFVTAMDTRPLAAEPVDIIGLHADWFQAGLNALVKMDLAPVYLCCASDAPLPLPGEGSIRIARFSGSHPAGLPGIHIQSLCPVGAGNRSVWQIHYSDVISLGRLMLEGMPWSERIVSVAGPGFANPSLVEITQGAAIQDVIAQAGLIDAAQLISGSPVDGSPIRHGFLGRRQTQLSALQPTAVTRPRAVTDAWPLIPTTDLDDHAPPGILATPLLRALLVGDADRAKELGALELLEEDLAGFSTHCSAGLDFGPLLRQVIDRIARDDA